MSVRVSECEVTDGEVDAAFDLVDRGRQHPVRDHLRRVLLGLSEK